MEISDIRRRFRQAVEQAKKAGAERRVRTDAATVAYHAFLRDIATPVFRMVANIARAENHPWSVHTPADGIRLASDRNASDFIELWLDTSLDPPKIATRLSLARGRDVTTTEALFRPESPINSLTDEDVLEFLLRSFGTLVER